jgi:flagellar hook-associated protein 2
MASISSLGVGSNLDLNTLLSGLRNAENAPLHAIQQQQTSYSAKLSAYGQLQAALGSLQTAATALSASTLFQGVKATSSASDVLGVSATSSAAAGSYTVNVTKLAQAQSLAAAGQASATADLAGGPATIKIQFGTISGGVADGSGHYPNATTFTADPDRAAQTVDIAAGSSSLTDIRDAINAKTALGVTASIVNDGSGNPYRLVLTSKTTGEESSMQITVTGDVALQNLLTYDPHDTDPDPGINGTQNMAETAVAKNAALKVNGIDVTSASNSVTDAIEGTTMTLASLGTSTVTVAKDTASVSSAITSFVTAYNNLQSTASKLSAYDAEKKSGAALLGDSALRNIQTRIRAVLGSPQASGTLTVLSQAGVSIDKTGTMQVNSTKLNAALSSDLSGVATLFSGVSGSGGYGRQVDTLITSFNSSTGLLKSAQNSVNTTLKALDKEYERTQERVDATIARYQTQFSQLDTLMARMNQTGAYLTQQFSAMNNVKSK